MPSTAVNARHRTLGLSFVLAVNCIHGFQEEHFDLNNEQNKLPNEIIPALKKKKKPTTLQPSFFFFINK